MNEIFNLAISSFLGFLGVNLLRSQGRIDPLLHIMASFGLGLALSGQIIFYSLFIFGKLNTPAVIIGHGLVFMVLLIANLRTFKHDPSSLIPKFPADQTAWLGVVILSLLLIPLWREAHFFPFGGWDAWACWNFKAKMIFLGAENWKQMLDVSMWRSNNQYPFLLPLMNVWGWTFYKEASVNVPMVNAILFTFLTALTMFWATKRQHSKILCVIPPLVLFSIPFINTLSISQYSDIVVAFFLLGTLVLLIACRDESNKALAILSGLFCGTLCFTKTEGALAALIIVGLAIPYLWDRPKASWQLLGPFLTAMILSALPAIFFQLLWATPNVSFINGLTSVDHPISFDRLKAIAMFLGLELISGKWNGLWILIVGGLFLSGTRAFKNGPGLIATFLGIYLSGALAFYAINTHYEILWWLSATLNRILYTILPVIVWWVFAALLSDRNKTG